MLRPAVARGSPGCKGAGGGAGVRVQGRGIPPWLPLNDARHLLQEGPPAAALPPFQDCPTRDRLHSAPNSLLAAVSCTLHALPFPLLFCSCLSPCMW